MTRFLHEFSLGIILLAVSILLHQRIDNLSLFELIVGIISTVCGLFVSVYAFVPEKVRKFWYMD